MGDGRPVRKFMAHLRFHLLFTSPQHWQVLHQGMTMLLSPLLLALAAAAGPAQPSHPPAGPHRLNRIFVSPMGEPFRPAARDDNTLADWFQHADRNSDGQLTLDEMQQDAGRFFAVLDANHDGEIDPDEIAHYENVVAPEIQIGTRMGMGAMERDDGHLGAARFGLLDLPEPVVSADSNFNRGISLAEFRQAAAQRFVALDVDHKGQLSLAGLETIRPAPPAGGQKRKPRPSGEDGPARQH
jgi:EF hand